MEPKEDICYPAVEIHRSGTGSLNMHAYKNNINQSSVDFVYENHELKAQAGGKELEIVMISPEKLKAVYHMRLFDGVPAVQTWTEIINEGSEDPEAAKSLIIKKQISMCRLTAGAVRHSGRNTMQKR